MGKSGVVGFLIPCIHYKYADFLKTTLNCPPFVKYIHSSRGQVEASLRTNLNYVVCTIVYRIVIVGKLYSNSSENLKSNILESRDQNGCISE